MDSNLPARLAILLLGQKYYLPRAAAFIEQGQIATRATPRLLDSNRNASTDLFESLHHDKAQRWITGCSCFCTCFFALPNRSSSKMLKQIDWLFHIDMYSLVTSRGMRILVFFL